MLRVLLLAAIVLGPFLVTSSCAAKEFSSAFAVCSTSRARHPVSVIEADIYVTKFKTTMRLRCFAEDLELLQGVEALDDGFYDSDELVDATIDHADFLSERIQLVAVDGSDIASHVVEIDHFEIPEDGIRQGQLMQYSIGVVLEFKYEQAPEFLTIQQDIIAEGLLLPSELKILLKQEGSDEPYFHMMKPGRPETFRFDWTKPAPNAAASEEEWSSWFEEQREKTLGIASYSSVYSFIYITNYEIRHEVLLPLATLNTFFEIERADPGYLDIEEQDRVAERIKTLFSTGNPVVIDNIEVQPVFDRIDFYGLDLRDFAVQAERRKVSMANGRVGIIMSYSTKGMPREVQLTWDKFNDSLQTVDSVVYAFEENKKTEFSTFLEDNTYRWNSDERQPPAPISAVAAEVARFEIPKIKVPLLSVVFGSLAVIMLLTTAFANHRAGVAVVAVICSTIAFLGFNVWQYEVPQPYAERPQIDAQQADDIFAQLHKNMFRAFDYHNESDIYDALARSVDGPLLRDLYLRINDSLRVREQGGAVSTVEEVNLIDGQKFDEPADPNDPTPEIPAFQYRSKWELLGTVEHWGHIHQRNSTYDAEFKVELIGGDWKITDMQVKDFSHAAIKTRLRTL